MILDHHWIPTDGGRLAAGFKGTTRDCGARAVAIAAGIGYREAYDTINRVAGELQCKVSSARLGVTRPVMHEVLRGFGFTWTPTMRIGAGCTVHLRADELPTGRLVVSLSRHYAAVIDGVLYDNHDSSRGGQRCVYGYWKKPEAI